MTGRLDGRVTLVTGAGQGLGRAYAHRLADDGATVALLDIRGDAAQTVADTIAGRGGRAIALEADVADRKQVDAAVTRMLDELDTVDVLVNNAGGALLPSRPFDRFTDEEWHHVLDVNLTGTWNCVRAAAVPMQRRRSGRIVNIASTVAARGYPVGLAPYGAAKAGVIGLTRMLARELGPEGITVNSIAPGYVPVDTPKDVHAPDAAARLAQQMIDEQCLKRSLTPDDLAAVVAFFASDDSGAITGQVINVDGGWSLR